MSVCELLLVFYLSRVLVMVLLKLGDSLCYSLRLRKLNLQTGPVGQRTGVRCRALGSCFMCITNRFLFACSYLIIEYNYYMFLDHAFLLCVLHFVWSFVYCLTVSNLFQYFIYQQNI